MRNKATKHHGGFNPGTPAPNIPPQRKHEFRNSASATTNVGRIIASNPASRVLCRRGRAIALSKLRKRTASEGLGFYADVVVPKRSAESLESLPSSAAASVKASSPVDGAAARDPDGEWAMSLPFARSLCACCSAPAKGRAGCGFCSRGCYHRYWAGGTKRPKGHFAGLAQVRKIQSLCVHSLYV